MFLNSPFFLLMVVFHLQFLSLLIFLLKVFLHQKRCSSLTFALMLVSLHALFHFLLLSWSLRFCSNARLTTIWFSIPPSHGRERGGSSSTSCSSSSSSLGTGEKSFYILKTLHSFVFYLSLNRISGLHVDRIFTTTNLH